VGIVSALVATRKLFIQPHNDDAVLFGCFTLLREKPVVLTVFDSHVQFQRGTGITASQRRDEDIAAFAGLGINEFYFLGLSDSNGGFNGGNDLVDKLYYLQYDEIWAPTPERNGNHQHNLVGNIAGTLWGDKVTYYMTYTPSGKSTGSRFVDYEPEWLPLKWKALACYESQWRLANTREHFIRDQREYYL
jgi:LmbE family N-acetylglucosaminyl deacetylase